MYEQDLDDRIKNSEQHYDAYKQSLLEEKEHAEIQGKNRKGHSDEGKQDVTKDSQDSERKTGTRPKTRKARSPGKETSCSLGTDPVWTMQPQVVISTKEQQQAQLHSHARVEITKGERDKAEKARSQD
jgi:hypothetical protein